MIGAIDISLALPGDAAQIARLSRDAIEHGLPWRWTEPRVRRSLADPSTNVAVARDNGLLLGFGIMKYGDDAAHLLLLAVHPLQRHRRVGSALLGWLEACAVVAGVAAVVLEARRSNATARAFYRRHGYVEIGVRPGYYEGVHDAVTMHKSLRLR